MIQFPKSTYVGRFLPKEAFYKRLNLTKDLRQSFVSDIKRISIEHSLSDKTLNIKSTSDINEIIALSIELKKHDIDYRMIEIIAKHNPHKILFILKHDEQVQLAVKVEKLYTSIWKSQLETELIIQGLTLDEIWNGFIEQIAISNRVKHLIGRLNVKELIDLQENITKLEKDIEKKEKKARSEKQPRQKWALVEEINKLKIQLGAMENG